MSWSDDNKLSLGVDAISWISKKKKKSIKYIFSLETRFGWRNFIKMATLLLPCEYDKARSHPFKIWDQFRGYFSK